MFNPDESVLSYSSYTLDKTNENFVTRLREEKPSSLPYLSSIKSYWGSYCEVKKLSSNTSENKQIFVKQNVNAYLFTFKRLVAFSYENTLGRLLEYFAEDEVTEEQKYYSSTNIKYNNFKQRNEWYNYNYLQDLVGLYSLSFFAPENKFLQNLRKIERKFIYTTNYSFKFISSLIYKNLFATTNSNKNEKINFVIVQADKDLEIDTNTMTVLKTEDLGNDIAKYLIKYQNTKAVDVYKMLNQRNNPIQFLQINGNDRFLVQFTSSKPNVKVASRMPLFYNQNLDKTYNVSYFLNSFEITEELKKGQLVLSEIF